MSDFHMVEKLATLAAENGKLQLILEERNRMIQELQQENQQLKQQSIPARREGT